MSYPPQPPNQGPPPYQGPPQGPPYQGPPQGGPPYQGPPQGQNPQGGGHWQPPPPPKKKHTVRNVLLGVLALFLLLGACSAIFGGTEDTSSNDGNSSSSAEVDTATKDKAQDKAPAKKTAKPKPVAKWKTVAKLSGNTNKAGSDFHLNGCDARMTYNVQGDVSATIVAFYVMESGKKLQEDGGIPVASPTKSGPGRTVIREDEGDYYIETVAANAEWQVQVQEKC